MNPRSLGVLCLAVLLSGCVSVGPDYRRPALQAPARWTESREQAGGSLALAEIAWWQAFGDPVLNGLMEQAVRTNLDLEQARARILQARADVTVAGASFWPALQGTGSVTRSQGGTSMVTSGSSAPESLASPGGTIFQAGFDASWEIDLFGGTRRSVEAARARLAASVEDQRATLLTLLGDVAKNYVDLRANQAQLDITRRNVKSQEQTVEVTRERYRLGLTTYLDVAQAEAQKASTASNLPTLEASIKQSIHRLGILLGQEPNALKTGLSASRPLPQPPIMTATGLPSDLLARRPDLRQVERQLAAASADIGVAQAELYPKFDLTAALGLQSNDVSKFLKISSGRYWSLVPGVTWNLFDGGKARGTVKNKQAVYREKLANYRASFLTALEEVENALAAYYGEQRKRLILVECIRANEDAVALARKRYRRGLTSFLDVLTAENSLYTAQSNLSKSEANLLTDLISLYKALGGGWNAAPVRVAEARGALDGRFNKQVKTLKED
ncbi:MAG: efflux transporter outer membrane subunit [Thermodesulfobacteriota bacterium]